MRQTLRVHGDPNERRRLLMMDCRAPRHAIRSRSAAVYSETPDFRGPHSLKTAHAGYDFGDRGDASFARARWSMLVYVLRLKRRQIISNFRSSQVR